MVETLKSLLESHTEWANLPIAICCEDGSYDYIGATGLVYEFIDDNGEKILLFSGN